jgi:hypothetical protein
VRKYVLESLQDVVIDSVFNGVLEAAGSAQVHAYGDDYW